MVQNRVLEVNQRIDRQVIRLRIKFNTFDMYLNSDLSLHLQTLNLDILIPFSLSMATIIDFYDKKSLNKNYWY